MGLLWAEKLKILQPFFLHQVLQHSSPVVIFHHPLFDFPMSLSSRERGKLGEIVQVWSARSKWRGIITSLGFLAVLLLIQPRIQFAFFAARADCWHKLSLLSAQTPTTFSAKRLPSQPIPSLNCCLGLFHPSCRTLHLSSLNF